MQVPSNREHRFEHPVALHFQGPAWEGGGDGAHCAKEVGSLQACIFKRASRKMSCTAHKGLAWSGWMCVAFPASAKQSTKQQASMPKHQHPPQLLTTRQRWSRTGKSKPASTHVALGAPPTRVALPRHSTAAHKYLVERCLRGAGERLPALHYRLCLGRGSASSILYAGALCARPSCIHASSHAMCPCQQLLTCSGAQWAHVLCIGIARSLHTRPRVCVHHTTLVGGQHLVAAGGLQEKGHGPSARRHVSCKAA